LREGEAGRSERERYREISLYSVAAELLVKTAVSMGWSCGKLTLEK